jgi:uncharacterized protein YqgC (DUF456 family)
MDFAAITLWIFSTLFTAIGLTGLIIPVIPGPILLLTGLVLAAWAEHFIYIGPVIIIILTLLAVLAHALDFLAGALGAKRFGASRKAAFGAAIGAVFGIFFGFIGMLLGPFIGALIGELTVSKNIQTAGLAGMGAWLGMVVGAAAKMAIGFSMVGIFIIARLF